MKILIAEDGFTSRTMLQGMLSKLGYEVVSTADGDEAWVAMQKTGAPQLAVLDWMMPGLDGVTLCRKLREQDRRKPLYIILLTSRGDRADIVRGLEAGADDYIAKPPDPQVLHARIEVGLRTLRLQNEINYHMAHMEELAQQRAVQLAHADRMTTLGLLSAGIAHEVNNPNSFIAVNIQTIEQNWDVIEACVRGHALPEERERALLLTAEMPAIVHDMKNGVSRIKDIVNGLKAYARTDGGRRARVSVNTCVEEALKLCRNRLKYQVEVRKKLDSDLPDIVGDGRQVEQVLVNLLINAADAIESSPGSGGTLFITTVADGQNILVCVRDTGPGIPGHDLSKIFKPFFTTKEVGRGTGLGLSISRNIVEEHGGALSVRNHPGGGAEFQMALPAAAGHRTGAKNLNHSTRKVRLVSLPGEGKDRS